MESSSQTPRVAPTVYTRMVETVSAGTVIVMSSVVVKASALTKVVKRVRRLRLVVHVACTVLEGQEIAIVRNVRSEGLPGQKQG